MSATITERLADCLRRQIAAFEQTRADLSAIDEGDEALVSPDMLRNQEKHLHTTMQLDEELQLLMPEWQKAFPPPTHAERERIAALAAQAQELADDLQRLYEKGQEMARGHAAKLKGERDSLRSKRNALRYHPNPGDDPPSMDRKA